MSDLQNFKREKVAPIIAGINELSIVGEDLQKKMKNNIFKNIILGRSSLISAEEYAQLREAYVTEKKLTSTQQKKIDLAYSKTQQAGFNGTQEAFEHLLFGRSTIESDREQFPNGPTEMIARLEAEYANDPEGRKEAIRKAEAIKTLIVSKEGNEVMIGGKTFSVLRPAANNEDVFSGPKGYEHITYIKGSAIEREVMKAGKKLFKTIAEAKEFINTYIPGSTEKSRLQNFATLLGLEKSGGRSSDGDWINQGKRGYAWLAESGEGGACYLGFSGDEADMGWSHLDLSLPVVVSQD